MAILPLIHLGPSTLMIEDKEPIDRNKDHLDRQLTTNMGAKSIGFSSPLSEGYCLQRIIPHYQFF